MLLVTTAVLLRILSNPLANVFQKQLTLKQHPLFVNFLTYLTLSFVCITFFELVPSIKLTNEFWFYSVLGGIAGSLGNGFLIKALQRGEISVLGPINSYKSVAGVVGGIFLLGEIPNVWGLIGIVLIIFGSYFIVDTTKERFSLALLKNNGILFRIMAVMLTAIEAIFIKKVILSSSIIISFFSWSCFGTIFSFVLLFVGRLDFKKEINKIGYSDLRKYGLLVLCIGIMQFSTNYAFRFIEVGYALSFFQLSILVSVLLGRVYFKEKNISHKLIGSSIMIAGSILIIVMMKH